MDQDKKFNRLVQFRVPESVSDALDAAANSHLQSKSEYVRRGVIDRLKADGVEVRGAA